MRGVKVFLSILCFLLLGAVSFVEAQGGARQLELIDVTYCFAGGTCGISGDGAQLSNITTDYNRCGASVKFDISASGFSSGSLTYPAIEVTVKANDRESPSPADSQRLIPSYELCYNTGVLNWPCTPLTFSRSAGNAQEFTAVTTIPVSDLPKSATDFAIHVQLNSDDSPMAGVCNFDNTKLEVGGLISGFSSVQYFNDSCSAVSDFYGDTDNSLYSKYFSCSPLGFSGDNVSGGCFAQTANTRPEGVTEDANTIACSDYLAQHSSGGTVCIPCVSADNLPDNAESLLNLEHGESCSNIPGVTVTALERCGAGLQRVCRQSEQSGRAGLFCLSPLNSLGVSNDCIVGENECENYSSSLAASLFCQPGSDPTRGYCTLKNCGVISSSVGLYESSECTSALGEAALCFGCSPDSETGSSGSCILKSTIEESLSDPAVVASLATSRSCTYESVAAGINYVFGDGTITAEELRGSAGEVLPPDSQSYGVKNCPEDELEDCARCMGYVGSGNTWTLDPTAAKGTWTAIGCINTTPEGIFVTLVRITLGVMGGVALLRLIYMGYLYQTGDEGKIKQAREGVVSTLVGIIVVVFSVVILRIIGVNVLDVVPSGFYGG